MRRFLEFILKTMAKLTLAKYKPRVVGITGSNGKSSAKEAAFCVLKKRFRVRRNSKNFNNEIGVPLSILGTEPGGHSVFAWFRSLLRGVGTLIYDKNYPEILILEMGVDKPGDMKYLMGIVRPQAGVVTAIGEFPVHLEFFPEKDDLIHEKGRLVQSVPEKGLAVLNYDDLSVRMIGDELSKKTKTIHYGFGHGADLRMSNFELQVGDLEKEDFGISFKLEYQGSVVPIRLNRILARQQAYAAAAAAGLGLFFGMNLVEISEALAHYQSLPGRTNLIKGIKHTWIIDDSYNASPLSTGAALDVLKEIYDSLPVEKQGRKIAVLGNMAELGPATEPGHRQVGGKAAQTADVLFAVGDKAGLFLADEARKQGMKKENIFKFERTEEARIPLQDFIEESDIILIKGSHHSMHMERLVKEIMAEPERAKELLVAEN